MFLCPNFVLPFNLYSIKLVVTHSPHQSSGEHAPLVYANNESLSDVTPIKRVACD